MVSQRFGREFGPTRQGAVAVEVDRIAAERALVCGGIKPNCSFWRYLYCRPTPFALDPVPQAFEGSVRFGTKATSRLENLGDLIYLIYLVVDLPGIFARWAPRALESCAAAAAVGCDVAQGRISPTVASALACPDPAAAVDRYIVDDGCPPCEQVDRAFFRRFAREELPADALGRCASDVYCTALHEECGGRLAADRAEAAYLDAVGREAWQRLNYGGGASSLSERACAHQTAENAELCGPCAPGGAVGPRALIEWWGPGVVRTSTLCACGCGGYVPAEALANGVLYATVECARAAGCAFLAEGAEALAWGAEGGCCGTRPVCPPLPWCHWANDIGQLLPRATQLLLCNEFVEGLTSDFLFIWEELAGAVGKELRAVVGRYDTREQLIRESSRNMRLYVPYPFSFSSSPGNALIQSNLAEGSAWPYPVQVTVEFERLANCVHVSHEGVVVCRRDNGERLSDDDLAAHLLVTYVHLHGDEKIRFRQRRRIEQLMVVADPWYFWPGAGQSTLSLPLGDYGSPIVEIIFVVRRGCNLQRGRRFDYSGVDGRDPILYAQVRYGNDLVRFPWRDGVYYHRVVPREVHSRVPRDYIHVASYALDPQCTQPSGMSAPRIQNLFLDVELQEGLGPNTEIIVFVRYYQRLYYEDHRAFVERALCI